MTDRIQYSTEQLPDIAVIDSIVGALVRGFEMGNPQAQPLQPLPTVASPPGLRSHNPPADDSLHGVSLCGCNAPVFGVAHVAGMQQRELQERREIEVVENFISDMGNHFLDQVFGSSGKTQRAFTVSICEDARGDLVFNTINSNDNVITHGVRRVEAHKVQPNQYGAVHALLYQGFAKACAVSAIQDLASVTIDIENL